MIPVHDITSNVAYYVNTVIDLPCLNVTNHIVNVMIRRVISERKILV